MSELKGRRIDLPSGATAWWPCHIGSEIIGAGTNVGALAHIGRDVVIGEDCRIQGSAYIADGCHIGHRVFIGPNATLTNDRHPPSGGIWSPVIVEDDVVIGGGATIVAGVTLHKGCVIGAGAVVTSDVESEHVMVGNPAKYIMDRAAYEARRDRSE
jgi:acetyltransferase-like isoleucine patch superfamily enzyme